nr:MAG TPA: hypothetical protein [Caudoviricetes sp.]
MRHAPFQRHLFPFLLLFYNVFLYRKPNVLFVRQKRSNRVKLQKKNLTKFLIDFLC